MSKEGAGSNMEGRGPNPESGAENASGPASGGADRRSTAVAASPRTDLISGATLSLLALAYGFGARGLADSGDPAVALLPTGLAGALALLSAGIALSGWRKLRHGRSRAAGLQPAEQLPSRTEQRDDDAEAGGDNDRHGFLQRPSLPRSWAVIALTILYAALFQALGYILATLLYTAAVAERFGAKRRTILLLVPCVTLLTYVLFRVILGARLPAGLLG